MKLIIAEKPELGQAIASALAKRDNKNITKISAKGEKELISKIDSENRRVEIIIK